MTTGSLNFVSYVSLNLRRSIFLVILVPPQWIVEPKDASIERNKNAALHCQAKGVPSPNITWKKSNGKFQ